MALDAYSTIKGIHSKHSLAVSHLTFLSFVAATTTTDLVQTKVNSMLTLTLMAEVQPARPTLLTARTVDT